MHFSTLTLSTLSASLLVSALKITYPVAGSAVSNELGFPVTWTTNTSDPIHINIVLSNTDDDDTLNLATNISSSARTYTVDALTIKSRAWSGNAFEIIINSAGDLGNDLLAISGKFSITNSTTARLYPTASGTSSGTSTSAAASTAATSEGVAAGMSGYKGVLRALVAAVLALAV